MKKWIALLLTALMLISLAACGGGTEGSSSGTEAPQTSEEAAVNAEETESVEQAETEPVPVVAAVAETVLAETDAWRITAKELTFDENGLPTLQLLAENLSQEALSFDLETFAVNQYMLPESFTSTRAASVADYLPEHEVEPADLTVEAGTQETWMLTVDAVDWVLLGISDIGEFQMRFAVTGSGESSVTEKIVLQTTLAGSYDTADSYLANVASSAAGAAFSGSISSFVENTYYDNGGIRITSAAVVDTADGSVLLLEAVNGSETDVALSFGKVCVNGYQISDEIWSATIDVGKTMILSYNFNESGAAQETYRNAGYYTTVLADCGITTFCELSMAVTASDGSGNVIAEEAQVAVMLSDEAVQEAPSGSYLYSGNGVNLQSLGRSSGPSGYFYELVLAENTNTSAVMVDSGVAYEINGVAVGCLNLSPGQKGIIGFPYPMSGGSVSSINDMNYVVYLSGGVTANPRVTSY